MTNDESRVRATGQCLCGGVKYEVRGPLRDILECHCKTCRRFSGGLWNATAARRDDITINDSGSLKWFASSTHVKRGFCGQCGSSLFWNRDDRDMLGITAGTLDEPTGLKLVARIFTDDTGDYYDLSAKVPSIPDGRHGLEIPKE